MTNTMKQKKLIVTSIVDGRRQVRVWEPSTPMGFGHPMRWVLERTPTGLRIRSLRGKGSTLQFDPSVIDGPNEIAIPDSKIKLQLRSAHSIRPAYLPDPAPIKGQQLPILLAFMGIRRQVVGSSQIHSAYIASRKGKPVFTVQTTAEGIKLTLLASKLHLKKSGRPSITGSPGETWKLSREDLVSSTITHGWHWWRFKLVQPEAIDHELDPVDEDDGFSKKTALLSLLLLAFLFVGSWVYRPQKPLDVQEIPIEALKSEKIVIYHHETPAPKPVVQEKVAKPGPVTPPHEVVAATQAPSPHPHARPRHKAAGGRTGVKSRAARIAEAQAKLLKEALGSVAQQATKIVNTDAGASRMTGIFAGKGPMVSATDVRPGFVGTDVKVGEIGGSGVGKAGSENGSAVGYGSGEHGSISGQGSSFVSAGLGGAIIDQGLSKAEVGAVIHAHMDEIRYCHEAAMLNTPGIQGRLLVDFSINPAGVVESASVHSSTLLPDTTIQGCLLKHLKTWKFPKPHGGVHVSVSYPFLFRTLSRDN